MIIRGTHTNRYNDHHGNDEDEDDDNSFCTEARSLAIAWHLTARPVSTELSEKKKNHRSVHHFEDDDKGKSSSPSVIVPSLESSYGYY